MVNTVNTVLRKVMIPLPSNARGRAVAIATDTQFGVTIASAVGLSCVSALTLCPALCAIMLKVTENENERKNLTYYTKKAYTTSYNAIYKKYSKSVLQRAKLGLRNVSSLYRDLFV